MELSFCRRLPKIELHAHLNGSLSEKTLKELYLHHEKNNSSEISGLECSNFFKDSYSLSSFFALFKMTYTLTATPESVEIATERVIEDFASENVIYLELRSTLRKEKNMTKREYLEAMIRGVLKCKQKFPHTSVKLIISINRSETIESAEENVKLSVEYLRRYPDLIVGIDISGNPTSSSFKDFVKVLDLARSEGLKITVHCAEVVGNDEIREILEFHPDRIGHGTCIHETRGGDVKNWNLLLEKRIPVELCLSSNIKCQTVDSYENHHFKFFYAAKHPIALATDDKGAFWTSLTEELEIVQNIFGLSEEEMWRLSYDSIDYIFADDEKELLKASTSLTEEFEIVQKTFGLSEEELWRLSYDNIDYIFADDDEKESLKVILSQWKIGNF